MIRNDFPQLDGLEYHYLDAAATSLTPRAVLDAEIEYYTHYRANVHRGLFPAAMRATNRYEEARRKVARWIGATDTKEVILNSGATESSNTIIRMLEETFGWDLLDEDGAERSHIVTTVMEHHAALVPIQELARRTGMALRSIPLNGLELDMELAEHLIDNRTALVSLILASNVTGMINDVRRIADLAHKYGAIVVLDATAAAGHIPMNVQELGADALYFSGHKMMAPTGIGVLWVRLALLEKLQPVLFGGHMIAHVEQERATWAPIPERFEAGTKNIAGAIGLGVAVDYLSALGMGNVHRHCATLAFEAIHRLEQIPQVRVYSSCDPTKNIGIVSFSAEWAHPHDIAEILAREQIAVRAGHHCAEPLHHALGVPATVRASFHVYNTKEDVIALVKGVQKARQIFTS